MHCRLFGLLALMLAGVACNLTPSPEATKPLSVPTAVPPNDGTRPTVVIEAPASGSQAVRGQQFVVRVRAADNIGVTRVEMREPGRVVGVQPAPDPVQNFEALLPYTPTNTGRVTLEVVAYRRSIASDPASITVEVVGSMAELRNPGSLDPTAGVASGAVICTARVNVNNLNLRSGPGTNYQVLTKLGIGEEMIVIGRSADSTWYQVRRQNTQTGWVSAQFILQNGDCSQAPIISVP